MEIKFGQKAVLLRGSSAWFCIVGGGETVICISRDSKSFAHLRPVISTGAIGWRARRTSPI